MIINNHNSKLCWMLGGGQGEGRGGRKEQGLALTRDELARNC